MSCFFKLHMCSANIVPNDTATIKCDSAAIFADTKFWCDNRFDLCFTIQETPQFLQHETTIRQLKIQCEARENVGDWRVLS
jgi:hypothetical protein